MEHCISAGRAKEGKHKELQGGAPSNCPCKKAYSNRRAQHECAQLSYPAGCTQYNIHCGGSNSTRLHCHTSTISCTSDTCIPLVVHDVSGVVHIVIVVEGVLQHAPQVRGEGAWAGLGLPVVGAHHLLGSLGRLLKVVVGHLGELQAGQ